MASKNSAKGLDLEVTITAQNERASTAVFKAFSPVLLDLAKIFDYSQTNKGTCPLNSKKFNKFFQSVVGKVVQKKFKPWIQQKLPTLPGVHEDSFYNLVCSGKGFTRVNCSPFGTTEVHQISINDLVVQNSVVAVILLLLHLCDLHVEYKFFSMLHEVCDIALSLMKKYIALRDYHTSTDAFCFFVHTYILPFQFTYDRKYEIEKDYKIFVEIFESGLRELRSWTTTLKPDIHLHRETKFNLMACKVTSHLVDWHVLWMALNAAVFVFHPPFEVEPVYYGSGTTPSLDYMRTLNCTIRILFNMGDLLVCAMHCWMLSKAYFVLSLLEHGSRSSSLLDATLWMTGAAQWMVSVASKYQDEHAPFTSRFHDQSSVIRLLPYHWDIPGTYENPTLIEDIICMLEEKRCINNKALQWVIALLVIVARYNYLPRLQSPNIRPSRNDYLEIILVIRMLYPQITREALKIYAFEHRRLKYLHENGVGALMKELRKQAFIFQLSCFPLLHNEVFLRKECPTLHGLGENPIAIEIFLKNDNRLSERMNLMKMKFIKFRDYLNCRGETKAGTVINSKPSANENVILAGTPISSKIYFPRSTAEECKKLQVRSSESVPVSGASGGKSRQLSPAHELLSSSSILETATVDRNIGGSLNGSAHDKLKKINFDSTEPWELTDDWAEYRKSLQAECEITLKYAVFLMSRQFPEEGNVAVVKYKLNLLSFRNNISLKDVFDEYDFDFIPDVLGGEIFSLEDDKLVELENNLLQCLAYLIKDAKPSAPPGSSAVKTPFFENKQKLKDNYKNLLVSTSLPSIDAMERLANWMEDLICEL